MKVLIHAHIHTKHMIISVLTDQWVSSSLSPTCAKCTRRHRVSKGWVGDRQTDGHKIFFFFFFHIPTDAALKKKQTKKNNTLRTFSAQGLLDGARAVWFAFKRKAKIASYCKHTNKGPSLLSLIDGHGVAECWRSGEIVPVGLLFYLLSTIILSKFSPPQAYPGF